MATHDRRPHRGCVGFSVRLHPLALAPVQGHARHPATIRVQGATCAPLKYQLNRENQPNRLSLPPLQNTLSSIDHKAGRKRRQIWAVEL